MCLETAAAASLPAGKAAEPGVSEVLDEAVDLLMACLAADGPATSAAWEFAHVGHLQGSKRVLQHIAATDPAHLKPLLAGYSLLDLLEVCLAQTQYLTSSMLSFSRLTAGCMCIFHCQCGLHDVILDSSDQAARWPYEWWRQCILTFPYIYPSLPRS